MTEQETKKIYSFDCKSEYKPLELYCIQDRKTGKFMPPFFCQNEDDAIRQVKNIVNYTNSLINKFPQDYALYFCGCFDEFHGCVSASDSIIDGFINYLDVYKTDDSIKFDEVKKEINEQKILVQNELSNLNGLKKEISESLSNMNSLYQKYDSSFNSRSHNVNEYAKLKLNKKEQKEAKDSFVSDFVDTWFHHFRDDS